MSDTTKPVDKPCSTFEPDDFRDPENPNTECRFCGYAKMDHKTTKRVRPRRPIEAVIITRPRNPLNPWSLTYDGWTTECFYRNGEKVPERFIPLPYYQGGAFAEGRNILDTERERVAKRSRAKELRDVFAGWL